jgi:hypothetical protein
MKNLIITEQQALKFLLLNEAVSVSTPKLNVSLPSENLSDAEKQNPALALSKTQNIAKTQGFPQNTNITTDTQVNGKDMQITAKPTTNECYILTKKQVDRLKLHKLKESSQIVKIKNFKK